MTNLACTTKAEEPEYGEAYLKAQRSRSDVLHHVARNRAQRSVESAHTRRARRPSAIVIGKEELAVEGGGLSTVKLDHHRDTLCHTTLNSQSANRVTAKTVGIGPRVS
eukprot:CAMPEP_0182537720 /NCGR_PEP_ID=MMETSP1323-20130603/22490_1 /TAXON_ID=236787 /ORGANISM="Florenciella parvula, Strain RCC1693" /LENGTH=107 /DNA_ID=CAMNT_0024748129 /DNA_START=107 /DNA_END=430 /DNA_ORIENTATION=-